MENIITNNTFASNEGTAKETVKFKNESDNQLSLWDKFKHKINQFLSAIYIIRCVCCFTSVFSVIGTLILLFGGDMTAAGIMFFIGLPSALLACPFRFMGVAVAMIVSGFSIGLCFLGFGCLIGAAIGFILAVVLFFYFPAFVTIPYFFKELIK